MDGLDEVLGDLHHARERAKQGREFLLKYMDAGRVANQHLEIYRNLVV
jgi:hypothetical protein